MSGSIAYDSLVRWPGLLLALSACGADVTPRPLRQPDRMRLWTEELPEDQIAARVAFVAAQGLGLNVNIQKGRHDRAYLQKLCDHAARHAVALRLWPNLSNESGYWVGQANADEFVGWTRDLTSLAKTACPRLDGIVFDLEMPMYRVGELASMRAAGASNLQIATWFLEHIDEAAFERARGVLAEEVRRLRADGYSATASTLPMNADDYDDGDETIAKALWTPIEGIDWEQVSFQVYRNLYDQQFPNMSKTPYTSGLIASYAKSAVAKWGPRAAVDLGTTGAGIGIPMGLASAAELQSDIAAALAEGIAPGHVAIYSLEGVLDKADAPAWLRLPAPMAAVPTTTDLEPREQFQQLDALAH